MVPGAAVGAVGTPVKLGEAKGANPTREAATKAVVGSFVLLSPGDGVGPVGLSVKLAWPVKEDVPDTVKLETGNVWAITKAGNKKELSKSFFIFFPFHLTRRQAKKPLTVMVDTVKVAIAMRFTVVVDAKIYLFRPEGNVGEEEADQESPGKLKVLGSGGVGKLVVVFVAVSKNEGTVEAALTNCVLPTQSQSPAVKDTEVATADTLVVKDVPVVVLVMYSPTLPALALLFVVVPTMPLVCDGVKFPVEDKVVKEPVLADVPPIAGGDAR